MLFRYDNLLPVDLFLAVQDDLQYWKFSNFSNGDSIDSYGYFWGDGSRSKDLLIFKKAQSIIKYKIMRDIKYHIKSHGVHLNCSTPNSMGSSFHTDFADDNYMTFVLYTAPTWNAQWGGETVVCKPDGKYEYIPYRPNSGCIFPSKWEHYGASPNAFCKTIRTSLAFTYEVCYNKPVATN